MQSPGGRGPSDGYQPSINGGRVTSPNNWVYLIVRRGDEKMQATRVWGVNKL